MEPSGVRQNSQGVEAITWALLLAVLLVVVGVSAYLFAAGPKPAGDSCPLPTVVLGEPVTHGAVTNVSVLSAAPACPLADFGATALFDNATVGALDPLADGARDGVLSFWDTDGNGTLSAGDRFSVDPTVVADYELRVHRGAEEVAAKAWRAAPSVALGPGDRTASGYDVVVASAAPTGPLASFGALLTRDASSYGRIRALADGARDGNLSFADRDGSGTLTAGDRFSADVAEPGGYVLAVSWGGEDLARANWTVHLPPGGVSVDLCCVGVSFLEPYGFYVESVSEARNLSEFVEVLLRDGGESARIDPLRPGWFGPLRFSDRDASGTLSAWDWFGFGCSENERLTTGCPPDAELPTGHQYEFLLLLGAVLVATYAFQR